MDQITSPSDIKQLVSQLTAIRGTLRRTPKQWFHFTDRSQKGAWASLTTENERAYSTLPTEIPVSKEAGDLWINLSADYLKAQHTIRESHKISIGEGMLEIAMSAVSPSPSSIMSLALFFNRN